MVKRYLFLIFAFVGFSSLSLNLYADETKGVMPLTAIQMERAKEAGVVAQPYIIPDVVIPSTSTGSSQNYSTQHNNKPRPGFGHYRRKARSFISEVETKEDVAQVKDEGELEEVIVNHGSNISSLATRYLVPDDIPDLVLPPDFANVPRKQDIFGGWDSPNLSGNHVYSNLVATNFSFNQLAEANLTIGNGVTLQQGNVDTGIVKDLHVLNVFGRGNKIIVTKEFTIGGDGVKTGLFMARGSQLTFRFENYGYLDKDTLPTLIFAEGFVLQLPEDAELIFEGEGQVIFENNAFINLEGRKTEKIINRKKVIEYEHKPKLIIKQQAALLVDLNSTAFISGIGVINVVDGGIISLVFPSKLVIGSSEEGYIDFNVMTSGSILLEDEPDSVKQSILSFPRGRKSITCTQGGKIIIRDGGCLSINVYNNKPWLDGYLTDLSFLENGGFAVSGTGRFTFASNKYNPQGGINPDGTQKEYSVNYGGKFAYIEGDGFIEYLGAGGATDSRSFVGKINPSGGKYDDGEEEIEELCKNLVNLASSTEASTYASIPLTKTIIFRDPDGKLMVRTWKDALIEMEEGSIITREGDDGSIVVTTENGSSLRYDVRGNLLS